MNRVNDYFLPYQRDWIVDDSPMKLYAKSRRIGTLMQPVSASTTNVCGGETSRSG